MPPTLCICAEITPLRTKTHVALVVHHSELIKSSSTARLIALQLPATFVRVHGHSSRPALEPLPNRPLFLLYPSPDAIVLRPDMMQEIPPVLIVPDGTWDQARRISQRDPDARRATAVRLPEGHTTNFGALRRTEREGAVSTFEAVARAIGILESKATEEAMLATFETFLTRSIYVRTHGERVAMDEKK